MNKGGAGLRSQSAMEYLMTYGWAILIIAVVLGAIYSLGLFSGTTLAPYSSPGACQVYRPNGPLTVQYISLAGACTNELPQYATMFSTQTSYISVPDSSSLDFPVGTYSVWVKYLTLSPSYQDLFRKANQYVIESNSLGSTQLYFYIGSWHSVSVSNPSASTWAMLTLTYDGNTLRAYKNGALITSTSITGTITANTNPLFIGAGGNGGYNPCNCLLSNFQTYNVSLDANSVLALYQEGIGGAPINLQSLTTWWPLNGNANDYSGNLNNGQPTAVTYTNQWLSGYTVP